ncbi:uncharacterized protein LOC144021325 isoform X2 [Festucalex cinctus]
MTGTGLFPLLTSDSISASQHQCMRHPGVAFLPGWWRVQSGSALIRPLMRQSRPNNGYVSAEDLSGTLSTGTNSTVKQTAQNLTGNNNMSQCPKLVDKVMKYVAKPSIPNSISSSRGAREKQLLVMRSKAEERSRKW